MLIVQLYIAHHHLQIIIGRVLLEVVRDSLARFLHLSELHVHLKTLHSAVGRTATDGIDGILLPDGRFQFARV